jgi:hypothetical protein
MDWDDEVGRAPAERSTARDTWREPRGDLRSSRKGLEDRLESLVSRGRELVDGVSGTRPGTRASGRGSERSGAGGRSSLDGLGRWVEGRLDWLLDDRDDWREPWQEADRPPAERWDGAAPPPRSSRPPLEAISRRGLPPRENPAAIPPPAKAAAPGGGADAARQEWPQEDTFSVPRWRREEPAPKRPLNPLADPPPPSVPGRPLPRSTRRR